MHIANAAMDFLAYTPSTKHFGLSNTQLFLGVIIGVGLLWWLIKK